VLFLLFGKKRDFCGTGVGPMRDEYLRSVAYNKSVDGGNTARQKRWALRMRDTGRADEKDDCADSRQEPDEKAPPSNFFKGGVNAIAEQENALTNDNRTTRKRKRGVDPKELQELINSYFNEHLAVSGEVADVESLAEYLGTTRDGLLALANDKKCGETVRRARNRIAMIKKQLAFNGKIPAAVLSFDLKNNHGYRDKPEDTDGREIETIVFKGKTESWAK